MKTLKSTYLKFYGYLLLCVFAAFSLLSCNPGNHASVVVVAVDPAATTAVDVSEEESVPLYCEYPLGYISHIAIKDKVALVEANESLTGFDLNTGRKLARYSMKGRGPGEYLNVSSAGFDREKVYIYDFSSRKIMYFDISGKLLEELPLETNGKSFQCFIRQSDESIIGQRVFGVGEIPELSLFDKNFRHISDIGEFHLRSGICFAYPFFRNFKNEILYVRNLIDDIYVIRDSSIRKAYSVDFGDFSTPSPENFRDEYEMIEYINRSPEKYATLIHGIYDSRDYLCFSFLNDRKRKYAVYEKSAEKARSFEFTNGDKILVQTVTCSDIVYLFWDSESEGLSFSALPLNSII